MKYTILTLEASNYQILRCRSLYSEKTFPFAFPQRRFLHAQTYYLVLLYRKIFNQGINFESNHHLQMHPTSAFRSRLRPHLITWMRCWRPRETGASAMMFSSLERSEEDTMHNRFELNHSFNLSCDSLKSQELDRGLGMLNRICT